MANYKANKKPVIDDTPFKVSVFGSRRFSKYKKQPSIGPGYVWKCDRGWEGYFRLSLEQVGPDERALLITVYSRRYEGANATWRIELLKEECNYGGVRWWFVCPITGKKCVNLYFYNAIGSREGLGLGYASQLESQKHRVYKHFFDIVYPEDGPNPIKYPYRNGKATKRQKGRVRRLFGMQAELATIGM